MTHIPVKKPPGLERPASSCERIGERAASDMGRNPDERA